MKKLLVVGAGFLQSFVISKAKSMGYETYAVDANPDAVGFSETYDHAVIDIVDAEACLNYAKDKGIDGVMTAATDFGVLTAAYIAECMDLPGIGYETAKLVKNKHRVMQRFYQCGVDDSAWTYEIRDGLELKELSPVLTFPLMIKPSDGSGSRGALRVDCPEDLLGAGSQSLDSSLAHKAVLEPFYVGNEYGAESIVVNGVVHVLAIIKKVMTQPPYYAELGHSLPCNLPYSVEQKATDCVNRAITSLGIKNGSVNMDMIITQTGEVHIVDVGARMGGNMIGPCIVPYGTGIDYMAASIQCAFGEEVNLNSGTHGAVASRLLAFREGTIRSMPDINELEKRYCVEIYHHMYPGMHVNEYHTNLDGCGYVIAKGSSATDAELRAELAVEQIAREAF